MKKWTFRTLQFILAQTILLLSPGMAYSDSLCGKWLSAQEAGRLDTSLIDESSGMAASRKFPRLYHVNDSGDGPHFYVSDLNGGNTKRVEISDFKPFDVEEIALGPCPGEAQTCLVIGDIGDNRVKRKKVEFVFVKEVENFATEVESLYRLDLKYEDGPHNAEAFSVLPNGDLVVVTKEQSKKGERKALPAGVYRIQKNELMKSITNKSSGVLQKVGEIDIPALTGDDGFGGVVTGMSLSSDGKRFLLLTYDKVLEFALDLSAVASLPSAPNATRIPKATTMKPGVDFNLIDTVTLAQQESITYLKDEKEFLYSSEVIAKIFKSATQIPIMKIRCAK